MLRKLYYILLPGFIACNGKTDRITDVLNLSGKNKSELEAVIKHYEHSGDKLKLKAAYYLIENLPQQYHYEGQAAAECRNIFKKVDSTVSSGARFDCAHTGDSIEKNLNRINFSTLRKVEDIKTISASFLINNIEDAFKAWHYPWAQNLSFDKFCEYILPYKIKDEAPDNWRSFFLKKYEWVIDSMRNKKSALEACTLINQDLKKWFYFTQIDFRFDPSFTDLKLLRSGRCPEEVQMTTYAMRAMGIPVAYDYISAWGNRNNGHDWNALFYNNKLIPFLGTEIDPGDYKIEFAMPGSIYSKRAKVFRRNYVSFTDRPIDKVSVEGIPPMFEDKRFRDVTSEYLPTANVRLELYPESSDYHFSYLCVFNNRAWRPVDWSVINHQSAFFEDMGTGILYLPALIDEGSVIPGGLPFILKKDGVVMEIKPDLTKRETISVDRKYPAGDDNKIVAGNNYELFYWNNKWISIGKQLASEETLHFKNVPVGALLWLKNLDAGLQERIFIVVNKKIVWW